MYFILRHSSHYEYNFLHLALTALASRDDLETPLWRYFHRAGEISGVRSQAELEKAGHKVKQIKLCRTLTEFSIHL